MPDANDPTPASWRVLALAVLGGGILVGDRAARGGAARLGAIAISGVVGLTVPAILRAGRRTARQATDPARDDDHATAGRTGPRFTVVVAARDEAPVIGTLVGDLARQDLRDAAGRPDLELVVVDDRSTDGTAGVVVAAAEAAGIGDRVRVVRREGAGLADGKGAALTAAPAAECRGDTIVVLDADARVDGGFLSALALGRDAGLRAMTAQRRTLDEDASWLAGAQADEQAADGAIQRGRWALGGMSEFRGNGIVVERALLESVGGWRAEALTEDLDLSSRIGAAAGLRVAWAGEAVVWEQPVRTWAGLWRQRVRWAEGSLRRYLEHGPSVLRSPNLGARARADFLAYGVQLVSPPVILGALVGGLRSGRLGVAALLVATYTTAGGGLAFGALTHDAHDRPLGVRRRVERGARMAAFTAIWLGSVPAALWRLATRRGPVAYHKMDHVSHEPDRTAAAAMPSSGATAPLASPGRRPRRSRGANAEPAPLPGR